MKILHKISLVLIAAPLLMLVWSSRWMIDYGWQERATVAVQKQAAFKAETLVHEAGFARITLALIGLTVLLVPYRRGEPWAFGVLVVLTLCYWLPVFLLGGRPSFGSWRIFQLSTDFGSSSPEPTNLFRYVLPILSLAGLALAVPHIAKALRSST
jgi:hypothetical protein